MDCKDVLRTMRCLRFQPRFMINKQRWIADDTMYNIIEKADQSYPKMSESLGHAMDWTSCEIHILEKEAKLRDKYGPLLHMFKSRK